MTHCDWKQPSTTFPLLRVALACCQITAPKSCIKDGFSKMVTKADFDKLRNKKMSEKILMAEDLMQAAWQVVEESKLGIEKAGLPFGRFQIGLILHLLQKEAKGREGVEYKGMEEIKNKFEEEFAKCGDPSSATPAAAPAEPTGEGDSAVVAVKSLKEASDSKAIALQSHKHIKIGKNYTFKAESKVWTLKDLTSTHALLVHQPLCGPEEACEILHKELTKLKEYSKPLPQLVKQDVLNKMSPSHFLYG